MFVHYLKIAFRNLAKYRLQTVICLIGLSVGMTCFALSSLWFSYISSFEDFVEDADRTYLLSEGSAKFQPDCADYGVRDAIAEKIEALKKYCPEIEDLYVWYPDGSNFKDIDGIVQIDYGPSNLSKVLNLQMLSGRGELLAPNEILVPRKWAIDKLGQEDVVGRSLTRLDWSNRPVEEVKIVGVFEDMPGNSALFTPDKCFGLWNGMSPSVYRVILWAKLYEGVDVDAVSKRAAETKVTMSYFSNFVTSEVTEDVNLKFDFLPLRKLRVYYPDAEYCFSSNYVLLFCAIGLLIIFSALCNYYITMIIQVRIRCRALAIRRMLGSGKWGIVLMNVVETLVIFFMSALVGALVIYFVKPFFEEYAEIAMATASFIAQVVMYCVVVLIGCVALTVVTTLYTMKVTQRSILYGHQSHHSSTVLDVVSNIVQISLSLCVLFCVAVMIMQVRYLNSSRDLGYERHNVLSIFRCPPSLIDYVKSSPLVVDTVFSSYPVLPMDMLRPVKISPDSKNNQKIDVSMVDIIPKEIDFWGLKLKEGTAPRADSRELLINETMAKMLDRDSIVGSTLDILEHQGAVSYTITGVLRNIYCSSVTGEPPALLYSNNSYPNEGVAITFKVAEGSKSDFLSGMEDFMAREGIEDQVYRFVDNEQRFDELLYKESLLLDVLIVIAVVSLIVSLFGVFSLLSLSLEQRKKEIALRKVHGATVCQVLTMFLKRQLVPLLVSAVIAFPLGYMIMKDWLSSYIQQVPIAWWLMPLILVVVAVVIFLTVIGCINSAVRQNPAEVIKNE